MNIVHPTQVDSVNNQSNIELTMVVPQDETAVISNDSPNKLFSFGTAVNYELKALPKPNTQLTGKTPHPPKRNPINIAYNIAMQETAGHNAMLYVLILSEAEREAIQLQHPSLQFNAHQDGLIRMQITYLLIIVKVDIRTLTRLFRTIHVIQNYFYYPFLFLQSHLKSIMVIQNYFYA